MKYLNLVAALVLAGFVGGCTSIADDSMSSVQSKLIKGKTTQAQVRQIFGNPIKTSFTGSGNESWEYEFDDGPDSMLIATHGAKIVTSVDYMLADCDKKLLVISFDRNKIVQQFTASSCEMIGGQIVR